LEVGGNGNEQLPCASQSIKNLSLVLIWKDDELVQEGLLTYYRQMKQTYWILALVVLVVAGGFLVMRYEAGKTVPIDTGTTGGTAMTGASDPKNATYVIEGKAVTLKDGYAQEEAAPGSASKVVTKYFGNDLQIDLNGDGRMDTAFILTQDGGGSGLFYYAVAALNTDKGYVGSDGYLLGDRVAPQSTNQSSNQNQKQVVVFNYAERTPGQPMSTAPSVGKSVYLKLDTATMKWGIVEPNFEGESR
jgi:hypothetical protein